MVDVVHLSTVHPSHDVRIRVKQCPSLLGAGFDVALIANGGDPGRADDGLLLAPLSPRSSGRLRRVLLTPWSAVRTLRNLDPTVVHFHDPELLLWSPLLRLLGYRTIYDVHEHLPRQIRSKEWIAPGRRAAVARIVSMVEPLLARFSDAVVIVEPEWSERFAKNTTILLRNYALRSEFDDAQAPDLDRVEPNFVYVGAISRVRGAEWFTEAAQLLPPHHRLTVAGTADAEYTEHLTKLDRDGRVDWIGWADRPTVLDAYGSALAGLVPLAPIPNYLSAVATKIFEYAHAGLPMILSDLPSHRALNEQYNFGLIVDFDDARALAEAMVRLDRDRDLAVTLGKNAAVAAQDFSWETDVEDLLRFYERYRP